MEVLRREMERKKREREELAQSTSSSTSAGVRFIRQADVMQREESMRAQRQRDIDEQRRKQARVELGLERESRSIDTDTASIPASGDSVPHNDEVELLRDEVKIDYTADVNEGQIDEDNEVTADETNTRRVRFTEEARENIIGEEDEGANDQDSNAADKDTASATGECISGRRVSPLTRFSSDPTLSDEQIVHRYFRSVMLQWEEELRMRDDKTRLASKGRAEERTYGQCKEYIRPLFKLCKRKQVPKDILIKLKQIVTHCEEGDFRSAHDHYIRAAIGNSAWPIGLTMVGIHERSGREKIQTDRVAHVMNNELQRKYFTSVKRLMTYAQTRRPDIPPSMKVL